MRSTLTSVIILSTGRTGTMFFANLGTHEIGWPTALALIGYSSASALTVAISSHIIMLFLVLVLGLREYTI